MKKAFTLAEVLITLTIIGIIAAMVIPSLMADINEKAFDTQRKALYARMSQAIPAMDKISGFGTLTGTLSSGNTQQSVTADTAAETFVTEGLSKVIKMNNMCYSDNITDCNFPDSFYALGGTTQIKLSDINTLGKFNPTLLKVESSMLGKYEQLDTKAAAFETANGESVLVYYNPNCTANMHETVTHYSQSKMCANFVYDLNGQKAPNTVGKDIGFISVLYSDYPVVVAPNPLPADAAQGTHNNVSKNCKAQDSESRAPNIDELTSMFYNIKLLNLSTDGYIDYWSNSFASSSLAWYMSLARGSRIPNARNKSASIRCIKR